MATEPKLKVNIGADTSQFEKGIRQTKSDLKAFGQVSDSVMGSLGRAIGVDTAEVEKMSAAIRGMGRQLSESGSTGVAAFGKLLTSVNALSVGIGALGIAGVVASFKALNAEAENFKTTVAGANLELQTAAFIDTYKQVFHDFNADTGKTVAEFQQKWKIGFAMLGANFQQNFVNVITGKQAPSPSLPDMFLRGNAEQMAAAIGGGAEAKQIAGELYQLERQQSDLTRTIADLDARIATNKEKMRDATVSMTERLAAYNDIVADINEKERLLVPIETRRTELMDRMVELTHSTPAAVDAANQQYVHQQTLVKSLTDEKAAQLRYVNSIRSQLGKQNTELEKHLALMKQIADIRALNLGVSGNMPTAGATTQQGGGLVPQVINTTAFEQQLNATLGNNMVVEIGVQIEKGSLMDLSRQVESVMAGLAESMSSAIGGLIGDLVTGGDAWGNFANAAMSAFGDMATSVGKIAIECGIAALGIKAALETLGPAGALAAIAAGTALVALGAAVKAGMSNIANGNYSASTSVASGSYASGGDYETRDLNIHVTGQLQADGDSLVAVLNNTNNRNGYTT